MKTIMQSLKTIVLALVIGLGVAYAAAWVGPTQAPPLANVPGPINKGSATQIIPNDIVLKGKTGTEIFRFENGLGGVFSGMFETRSNTYLATDGASRVGIGTANPTALLDVGSDATYEYQYQSEEVALSPLSPSCDCDVNTTTEDCATSFPTTDPAGSICYDNYNNGIQRAKKYLSVETAPAKRLLAVSKTEGVKVNGDDGLILELSSGVNSWRLIANGATGELRFVRKKSDGTWDFANEFKIGEFGDITVEGGVTAEGKLTANRMGVSQYSTAVSAMSPCGTLSEEPLQIRKCVSYPDEQLLCACTKFDSGTTAYLGWRWRPLVFRPGADTSAGGK